MIKKRIMMIWLALAALFLCGCSMQTVTDLYCLPMRSEKYTNLQSVMQNAMDDMDYSAPISGDNQQTVQSADLNGDGEAEYLLFAKNSSEKPLHIFVFTNDGNGYRLLDTIVCSGSSFDQVEYVQIDGRPGSEIVVGRQVSNDAVRTVSVYTLVDDKMEQMLTTSYTKYITSDLNSDGSREIFVLRPGEDGNGVAAVYSYVSGEMERSKEVNMSEPADNIKRIMTGLLQDGLPAVYVACSVGGSGGIVTDVFALVDEDLQNVSFSSESGTSVQTLRNYYIYADDIDADGILELPNLITMKGIGFEAGAGSQYMIRWFSMNADGSEVDKLYTYHNYVGGWYLELDGQLARRFAVNQLGNSFEFSIWDPEYQTSEKVMTLYVLTGQKREEQALADNRFILLRTESTIYAANLEVASSNYGMSKESLIGCFHLIQEDWQSGGR